MEEPEYEASNPGGIFVNPIRFLRFYPTVTIVFLVLLLGSAAVALTIDKKYGAIGAGAAVVIYGFYWAQVVNHFRIGDANPGYVVSLDPMLIAVATDLTKGEGNYPVVKIFQQELPTVRGQPPKVGTKLATVAMYRPGFPPKPHWGNFDPKPADCATGNLEVIERVMDSFDDEQWARLKEWLGQVPRPFKPGLYHIRDE